MRRSKLISCILSLVLVLTMCIGISGCSDGNKLYNMAKTDNFEYVKTVAENTNKMMLKSNKILSLANDALNGGSISFANKEDGIDVILYTSEDKFAFTLKNQSEDIPVGEVKAWIDKDKIVAGIDSVNEGKPYMLMFDNIASIMRGMFEGLIPEDSLKQMEENISEAIKYFREGKKEDNNSNEILKKILSCFDIVAEEEKNTEISITGGVVKGNFIVCTYSLKETTVNDLIHIFYDDLKIGEIFKSYNNEGGNDFMTIPEEEYVLPETADEAIELINSLGLKLSGNIKTYVDKKAGVPIKTTADVTAEMIVEDEKNNANVKLEINYPKDFSFMNSFDASVVVEYDEISAKSKLEWITEKDGDNTKAKLKVEAPSFMAESLPEVEFIYNSKTNEYSCAWTLYGVTTKLVGKAEISDKVVQITVDKSIVSYNDPDIDIEDYEEEIGALLKIEVGTNYPECPTDVTEIKTIEDMQNIIGDLLPDYPDEPDYPDYPDYPEFPDDWSDWGIIYD